MKQTEEMKNIVILIVAFFALSSCLQEDELKRPFASYEPVQLNDGWQVSNPMAENIDAAELEKIYSDFHADMDIWQVRSMLVFRNGKLVAESYTKDDSDRETPRAIWSQTKQVMGILTGIAIDNGLIGGVTDPVKNYLPEMAAHPDKSGITIEHLLTMKSGIDYSNDGLVGQTDNILRQLPANIIEYILSRPLKYEPGNSCNYKDCDPQLVAAILQKQCGKPLHQWASEKLFSELGIKNIEWLSYKDGTTLGGFGILSTPREMAKFGHLVMNKGKWNGKQIVSEAWIDEMTAVHVLDLYGKQFGYLWWSEQSQTIFMMNGHGGQYVMVEPDKNLVVAMTAEVNTQGDFQFSDPEIWFDKIARICH